MAAVFFVLVGLLGLALAGYVLVTSKYDYWKKKKVPYLKPVPLFGNYTKTFTLKKHLGLVAHEICQQFPDEPYVGTFYGTDPALLVQDPELIRIILAKDYTYFNGRVRSDYSDREPNTRNMFFTYGDRWKVIRQNTSPLLTTAKVKTMFHLVAGCTRTFEELLERERKMSSEVEIKDLTMRFTMDCICNCAFGLNPNTMGKDVANNSLKKIGDMIFKSTKLRGLAPHVRSAWPRVFYAIGWTMFPKAICDYFTKLLSEVFEQRNQTVSTRNDFVDLMLNLKKEEYISCESIMSTSKGKTVTLKVDEEFLVAQCVMFFAAGFETSSSVTSFTLYELAKNPDAQERVQRELDEYLRKRDGKLDYDCVTELPYLEACVNEAMRLYPVIPLLTREVMDDYTMPDGLRLEKGLHIHLPVYHMHVNPKFFPEPEKFKPERFLPENRAQIKQYTYMPFGEGHRICIGKKVGVMQVYSALVTVLRNYRMEMTERTPRKVTFNPCLIAAQSVEGVPLRLIPRK